MKIWATLGGGKGRDNTWADLLRGAAVPALKCYANGEPLAPAPEQSFTALPSVRSSELATARWSELDSSLATELSLLLGFSQANWAQTQREHAGGGGRRPAPSSPTSLARVTDLESFQSRAACAGDRVQTAAANRSLQNALELPLSSLEPPGAARPYHCPARERGLPWSCLACF